MPCKINKMKKQKPITKHLAPQYYELAKEKILSDRMCWDYAMKFQRCKNDIDYMQLGLGLQSIPFVVESIEQDVIPIPTLKEQLEPYINGKYIVKNVMQLERVSGEYFIDFNNDCANIRTNTVHFIGCSNLVVNIPRYRSPILAFSNGCKDIKIVFGGLNNVTIHVFNGCNLELDINTLDIAKSIRIVRYGKDISIRNSKDNFYQNIKVEKKEFKVK